MEGVKNFLASKTVIAALLGLLLTVGQSLGYVDPSATVDSVQGLLFGLAAVFRVTATKQITVLPQSS